MDENLILQIKQKRMKLSKGFDVSYAGLDRIQNKPPTGEAVILSSKKESKRSKKGKDYTIFSFEMVLLTDVSVGLTSNCSGKGITRPNLELTKGTHLNGVDKMDWDKKPKTKLFKTGDTVSIFELEYEIYQYKKNSTNGVALAGDFGVSFKCKNLVEDTEVSLDDKFNKIYSALNIKKELKDFTENHEAEIARRNKTISNFRDKQGTQTQAVNAMANGFNLMEEGGSYGAYIKDEEEEKEPVAVTKKEGSYTLNTCPQDWLMSMYAKKHCVCFTMDNNPETISAHNLIYSTIREPFPTQKEHLWNSEKEYIILGSGKGDSKTRSRFTTSLYFEEDEPSVKYRFHLTTPWGGEQIDKFKIEDSDNWVALAPFLLSGFRSHVISLLDTQAKTTTFIAEDGVDFQFKSRNYFVIDYQRTLEQSGMKISREKAMDIFGLETLKEALPGERNQSKERGDDCVNLSEHNGNLDEFNEGQFDLFLVGCGKVTGRFVGDFYELVKGFNSKGLPELRILQKKDDEWFPLTYLYQFCNQKLTQEQREEVLDALDLEGLVQNVFAVKKEEEKDVEMSNGH